MKTQRLKLVKTKWLELLLLGLISLSMGWAGAPDSLQVRDSEPEVAVRTDNLPYKDINLTDLVSNDLADYIESIVIDNTGAIYVVGKTSAAGFPLVNPFQSIYGGGDSDGFITVFAPDGQSLLYSTYLGGNGMDIIKDIAISDTGEIILTGATGSNNFPLANPYQSTTGGAIDAFVTVFKPDLQTLSFSTYLGAEDQEFPASIAIDSDGSILIAGYTYSVNFPVKNPIQTNQEGMDVFVTGFSQNGQSLLYSTYLGGIEDEEAYEIVIGSDGRKYITGYTGSADFPIVNAYQPNFMGGAWDGFVTVLNADGQSLAMSTFLGGSLPDRPYSIEVDSNNRIYVGGGTQSDDFPLANPYQPSKNVGWDGFLTIFNPGGQSLFYSTFMGGNAYDSLTNIAVNENGQTYSVGYTYSTDFPLVNPYQSSFSGSHDVFLTSFESDGQSLLYSTYLGGADGDIGHDISLDNSSAAYFAGVTWSADFPLMDPYQSELTGYVDGFVSKLNPDGQSLQYSTYLGGSYPAPSNVSLNQVSGETTEYSHEISSWLWLLSALILFFLVSLLFKKIVRIKKV